jgi:N-acetylmuramoyl-L-alanine amidase
VATEGETIRQKKQSDLRRRVEQVNALASAVVVSIHQNHFGDSRYSGPQVFFADGGEDLAKSAQEALTAVLAPGSNRASKQASGVYLMEHIAHPGILVECGFLSNPDEERRLATPAHQKKIAATLAAVLAGFVHSGI